MLDSEVVAFAVVAAVVTVVPAVGTPSPRPSAILLTSAALFSAVKLAGAPYLVTLGAPSLWRAIAPAPTSRDTRCLVLRRPRVRRCLDGVTGAVPVGLGGRLAWARS